MATPKSGYFNAAGKKLPSVTTILSRFKDSGALLTWSYRTGREHGNLEARHNLAQQITDLMSIKGMTPAWGVAVQNVWENCFPTPPEPAPASQYDVSGKAAAIGTHVHEMCEIYVVSGKDEAAARAHPWPADVDEDFKTKALSGFGAFLKWWEFSRLEIIHTELMLKSELHQFGGTLDFIGQEPDGTLVMGDFKTSNGVYADYLYQLGAYAILWEEHNPQKPIKGYHLLRFAKEKGDFAHHYFPELEQERQAFLLMRQLYAIDQVTRKRV